MVSYNKHDIQSIIWQKLKKKSFPEPILNLLSAVKFTNGPWVQKCSQVIITE